MSDKPDKAKKGKKSTKGQPSVLGSLPTTRPDRLGRRGSSGAAKPAAAKPGPAATGAARPAAPKPARPTATRSTAASRAAAAEKVIAAERAAARRAAAASGERPRPAPAEPPRKSGPPTGPEIVTTAVQAAGELAQIGFTVGGQILKRAVRRLPRP
jgi:hypothetical protein